jgi:hypothetical protein
MTSESRVVFDLKDILGVRFVCKECGSVSVAAANDWRAVPAGCGQCGKQWLTAPEDQSAANGFRLAFKRLRELGDKAGVSIQLEVDAPRA